MDRLEIRFLPLSQLVPAPYNPRKVLKPTDKAWQKLQQSIQEFGLVEPLIWNETTGHVVGGHLRLSILRHLNLTEAPVCVARLTEAREKALNVILNNGEAQSRYDADKLQKLLTELEDLPEFDLTGFDQNYLEDLRFDPIEILPAKKDEAKVEITLEMTEQKFVQVKDRLNSFIGECDLASHVRRC